MENCKHTASQRQLPWSSRLGVGVKKEDDDDDPHQTTLNTEPKNGRRSLNSGDQGWDQAVGPEKMKINKAHLNVHKKCIL
jgi:hypothetical protein